MGTVLSRLTAPGTKGRPGEAAPALRWGRAGWGRKEKPLPGAAALPAPVPFCERQGGPAGPRSSSVHFRALPPPKPETNPQSHQNRRLFSEITQQYVRPVQPQTAVR